MKINTLKNIIIISVILVLLFSTLVTLNITMGFMKIEENLEYAMKVENSNFAYAIGSIMFTGAIYTLWGSTIISIMTVFLKRINMKIKMTLHMLPFFTALFTLPALLVASEIAEYCNLIG